MLLVDDEVNAVSALAALLGDEGLDVASATSGERALTLADSRWPDVAVLDVQMPGMDGFTLSGRLQQEHALAGPRIMMLSSVDMRGQSPHDRTTG